MIAVFAVTDEPWLWWALAVVVASAFAAVVAILAVVVLTRTMNRRPRPPV